MIIIPRITTVIAALVARIYVSTEQIATTRRVTAQAGLDRRQTPQVQDRYMGFLIAAVGVAAWLPAACGGQTTLDPACVEDCAAAGGSGGSGGETPVPIPLDAAGVCGHSCGTLAALDCAAGYDTSKCVSSCEAALLGQCGIVFGNAIECLLEHGRAQCSKTGAPELADPKGSCHLALEVYTGCLTP
jgi:hypothetical protein